MTELTYKLDEIDAGQFVLTPSMHKDDFPSFLFSSHEVREGSYVSRSVFYGEWRGIRTPIDHSEVIAAGGGPGNSMFKESYRLALEEGRSLGLPLVNAIKPTRATYFE